MDEENQYPYILQLSGVDECDVSQEMELLRLEGLTPSRHIVRARLQPRELLYSGDLGARARAPFVASPSSSYDSIERLVSWATEQSDLIYQAVLDFLDDPEQDTSRVLSLLSSPPSEPSSRGGTLAGLLRRALRSPQPIEALYELARREHGGARPEAAVRQYLRRMSPQLTFDTDRQTYQLCTGE